MLWIATNLSVPPTDVLCLGWIEGDSRPVFCKHSGYEDGIGMWQWNVSGNNGSTFETKRRDYIKYWCSITNPE